MKLLKSSLFVLVLLCAALSIQSCKDECEDVVCQNGGTCNNGTCDCPDGFLGENCEIQDLCFGIICENDGTCENGVCDCPTLFTGANCEIFDTAQVQVLLDLGKTPMELFADNAPLSSLYGKTYEGGLIFYLDTITGNGMVAATEDLDWVVWGCGGVTIPGTSEDIGTGQANTTAIINGCSDEGIAARLCDDLVLNNKDDWFLPSKDELNLMWLHLADSDGNGMIDPQYHPNNIGGFNGDRYWSSTEDIDFKAWVKFFDFGGPYFNIPVLNVSNVRAARSF